MSSLLPFALEKKMAANTVNLDALIARSDFAGEGAGTISDRTRIQALELDQGFLFPALRKPDFQRETSYWTPQKVVDLIEAFISGDLIPAVILWQRGAETFVIDGAHRLSALIAWIKNDYGSGSISTNFFGGHIPPEQRRIAERTQKLVENSVGPYSKYKGLLSNLDAASRDERQILSALNTNAFVVQWVPASDAKGAEKSFFKINQAATSIDPTERRILQARDSANAIASRCIVRSGKGHKYWGSFSPDIKQRIEQLGSELYDALFHPPLDEPINTLSLPVAGRGYNQLPFVFDYVNICNNIPIPEKADSKKHNSALLTDQDGLLTMKYLESVKKRTSLITTDAPGSLGLHPAVYFYAMSGNFMPNAYLAASEFAEKLRAKSRLDDFSRVRRQFEDYMFENKIFISLTVTKLGSGARSLGRLANLLWVVFEGFVRGDSAETITEALYADPNYAHLSHAKSAPPRTERGRTGRMSGQTKSAVGMRDGYASVVRCGICGAAVHFRSSTVDHIERRSEGGSADMRNGQTTHPYCNTGSKG